jgi:hypothetical protein
MASSAVYTGPVGGESRKAAPASFIYGVTPGLGAALRFTGRICYCYSCSVRQCKRNVNTTEMHPVIQPFGFASQST